MRPAVVPPRTPSVGPQPSPRMHAPYVCEVLRARDLPVGRRDPPGRIQAPPMQRPGRDTCARSPAITLIESN